MARALTPSEVSMTSADSLVDPYFAEDKCDQCVTNVTAQLGLTTYLHCKVNNLNGKTVSQLIFLSTIFEKLKEELQNKFCTFQKYYIGTLPLDFGLEKKSYPYQLPTKS